MDHLRFQSSQTAASYVADQLDPQEQEAFELHMMSCPECVGEVESWRAIQDNLPEGRRPELAAPRQPDAEPAAASGPKPAAARRGRSARWRVAVSLAAVALASAAGGWLARSTQASWSDSEDVAFYNLPAVARGASDCLTVRLEPGASVLALRVTGAASDQQLVAVDATGRDLKPASYAVNAQGDGSWLLRLRAASIGPEAVRFEVRSADGTVEPRGCVMSVPRG